MAILNGGRMIALFLSMLFALNVSFAQEDDWVTVAVYMVDPIGDEEVTEEVEEYMVKWRDPLLWTTFERDFTPAREAQLAQVARDNAARILAAEAFLKADIRNRGDGTSSWYPAWIPLAYAKTTEDSLFKNILGLEGPQYGEPLPGDPRQTLRAFFETDGYEPDGLNANGSQKYRACNDNRPRCRKELYAIFSDLVEVHDSFQASRTEFGSGPAAPCLGCPVEVYDDIMVAPRIISFTIRAKTSEEATLPNEDLTFVGEQNEQGLTKSLGGRESFPYAEFDYTSIRLLQPAVHDPDEYVIDVAPYWRPAAKPVSAAATEASSWGRIKATFAD